MTAAVLFLALTAASVEPAARDNAVALNVGLASAIGELGVTYERSIGSAFRLEVGFGWGYSGDQVSVMPKLSLREGEHRFVTGIGVGVTVTPGMYTRGNPVWLNMDVGGYEFRSVTGFFFSAAGGLTWGLGGGAVCIVDCEGGNQYATTVVGMIGPQARIAAGWTF